MAIFIIGAKKINGQRFFRLLNTSTAPMKTRDMNEEDLMYMLDGNSSFHIENAELSPRRDKIVGKTGSLEKIENKDSYVVLSGLTMDGELLGYRVVDSYGLVRDLRLKDVIPFLSNKSVQNASIVNGRFLRGINWEIPMFELNRSRSKIKIEEDCKNISHPCDEINDSVGNPGNPGSNYSGCSGCTSPHPSDYVDREKMNTQSIKKLENKQKNNWDDEKVLDKEPILVESINNNSRTPIKVKLRKAGTPPRIFPVYLSIYIDNIHFEQLKYLTPFMKRWTLCDKLYNNQLLLRINKIDYVIYVHEEMAEAGYLRDLGLIFGNNVVETGRIDNMIEYTIKNVTGNFKTEFEAIKTLTERYGSKLTINLDKTKHLKSMAYPFCQRVIELLDTNPLFFEDYLSTKSKFENMFGLVEKSLMNTAPYIEQVCSVLGIKFNNLLHKEVMRVSIPSSVDYTSDDKYGFILIELN